MKIEGRNTMLSISKTKRFWFFFLLTAVVGSNALAYRLDALQPAPKNMMLGTMFDFMLVIPLLTYLFIIRKKYSLKYVLPVIIIGFYTANLIVPGGLYSSYSFVPIILFIAEGIFISLELYVVYKLLTKLPAMMKQFKLSQEGIPIFQYRLSSGLANHLKPSRTLDMFSTELSIWYYSLFSWKAEPPIASTKYRTFTFHKKTSFIAVYIMLIHALIFESIGFHWLLHNWSPTVSVILLMLNLYGLIIFVAEIQAVRLCPIIMTEKMLHMQIGVMKQLSIPLSQIKSVHVYQGPEKLSKAEADITLDAVLPDFIKEKPAIEIECYTPQEVKLMYGFTKKVTKIHLSPDEPHLFLEVCQELLSKDGERE